MKTHAIGATRTFATVPVGSVFLHMGRDGYPVLFMRCEAPWEGAEGHFAVELDPKGRDFRGVPGRRSMSALGTDSVFELFDVYLKVELASMQASDRLVPGMVAFVDSSPCIVVASSPVGEYLVDAETGIAYGERPGIPPTAFTRWSVAQRVGDGEVVLASFGG
ncbi:hypothetical protein [Arenibaculum pallidiluteum]|uniref:hypothetical protein n=1 Tax=Arenibaculum pallidiluteum TaxID=2812559 RepID=UPI001A95854F|nr:hypothetical protein [Arenibaculum pallidiluteum]